KEFAFDHIGKGYTDRYNSFRDLKGLEAKIKNICPYAVCASTAYYKHPEKREDWLKAELVFDIDAKDQPIRHCDCKIGTICEKCLEESKQLALTIIDTLKGDFGLKEIYLAYSGRGYHIHVLDPSAQKIKNRGHIFEYVTGAVMPADFQMVEGYARIWRKMFALTLSKMKEKNMQFLARSVAKRTLKHRHEILQRLEMRRADFLDFPGIGKSSRDIIIKEITNLSNQTVDGKVTVDTKRILRLPSTLHSMVSMICTIAKDPENFDPFKEAVPRFVDERS
ncbi:MAG: DNA primase catalytic subunit PriS, partial [Candidatus Methanofastidiosia archaeon]